MVEPIVKDVGEIYSSIFDHKPTLKKEIEYFVKEFEEKRSDREIDHLFKILERVTVLQESEINKTKTLLDIHLPKLTTELQVAESIIDKLVEKEEQTEKTIQEKLNEKRAENQIEWDRFVHDMTNKCIRIDNSYKLKGQEVREIYQKAEDKLLQNQQSPV